MSPPRSIVMARWPWPSSSPELALPASIAAATRAGSKRAQARTRPGLVKSTTSIRIVVAIQDLVDGRAEPDHAAAQVEGGNLERQHGVVGRGRRRRANGNIDTGIAHHSSM
jgi:hypothetical protein